jgi:hypothetical protein
MTQPELGGSVASATAAARPLGAARFTETFLPMVLPASATSISCEDSELRARLAGVGVDTRSDHPHVVIGLTAPASGHPPCTVVVIGSERRARDRHTRRVARAARKLVHHVRLRRRVSSSARRLRRDGYRSVEVTLWDKGRPVGLPGAERGRTRGLARLPEQAVIRAVRAPGEATAFEAALQEASEIVGTPLRPQRVLPTSGVLVVLTPSHVLRVATGPAWKRLAHQAEVLQHLASTGLSDDMRPLLPQVVATDLTGITRWTLESRVPGTRAPATASPRLQRDYLRFLVALFRADAPLEPVPPLADDAEAVGSLLGAGTATVLRDLAGRLEADLRGLPRGLAHGDFFPGNILVRGGRLSGVVDWDTAGARRLPLVDLLHLIASTSGRRGSLWWGPTIVDLLLPMARRGGSAAMHEYCQAVGIEVTTKGLEALVAAYWLGRVRYQLTTYDDRVERPTWLRRNVHQVLAALVYPARNS